MSLRSFTILLLLSATSFLAHSKKVSDEFWLGGGIGVIQPSNLGSKSILGYKDVASTGLQLNCEARWFYSKVLSIGGEISYAYTPQNDQFWYVRNYGEVTNFYRMANIMAFGQYYFSHKEWRPYAGIGFGASYLMNKLNFKSNYSGTDADDSVSYKTKDWKPTFAPEVGVLAELSDKIFFYAKMRFQVIPNMEATAVELKDDSGYTLDYVTQNPHGNQNHFAIALGLIFQL